MSPTALIVGLSDDGVLAEGHEDHDAAVGGLNTFGPRHRDQGVWLLVAGVDDHTVEQPGCVEVRKLDNGPPVPSPSSWLRSAASRCGCSFTVRTS